MPASLVLLACLAFAYVLGAVPFGYLLARWTAHANVLEVGSGNIGATNVRRVCGMRVALAVFVLDTLKGTVPVLVARSALPMGWEWGVVGCGIAAVVGHNWSVFLRFRGGRGVSTSLGVIVGLSPLVAALGFAAWVVVLAGTRYVSLASMVGAAAVAVLFAVLRVPLAYQIVGYLGAGAIVWRHRPNIGRLLRGQEPKAWGSSGASAEGNRQ